MRYEEVIRAWKNPAFRATLTAADAVMVHPAGLVELTESDLDAVSGAGGSSSCGGGKSGKSGKSKKSRKSRKSRKSHKSHKSSGSGKSSGGYNHCGPCR